MSNKEYDYYDEGENEGLDIVDLIFIMLRRWKLIALTTVPIVILGFVFANTRPTIYRAQTSLMVAGINTGVTLNSDDMALNQKLIATYLELAKSDLIMQRVVEKFDLQESTKVLAANIYMSAVPETEIIKLSYKNRDPQLAAAVTNEVAQQFISRINQVMKIRNISVLERAEVPQIPMPKNKMTIIIASMILGVSLGMGIIFIIEFIFSKLRKPKDIEKILKLPMLGMIPEFSDIDQSKGEKDERK